MMDGEPVTLPGWMAGNSAWGGTGGGAAPIHGAQCRSSSGCACTEGNELLLFVCMCGAKGLVNVRLLLFVDASSGC